jgi:hypothetical protein
MFDVSRYFQSPIAALAGDEIWGNPAGLPCCREWWCRVVPKRIVIEWPRQNFIALSRA